MPSTSSPHLKRPVYNHVCDHAERLCVTMRCFSVCWDLCCQDGTVSSTFEALHKNLIIESLGEVSDVCY